MSERDSIRGAIWLGDLVSALIALQPTSESERLEILEILGIPRIVLPETSSAAHTAPAPTEPTLPDGSTSTQPGGAKPPEPEPPIAPTQISTPSPRSVVASTLEPLLEEAGDRGAPATLLVRSVGDTDDVSLPFEPLLVPRSTRAILTRTIASYDPNGPPDVAAIVEALSRRQALVKLPRRWVRTLRRGVQVLIDAGESMTLFRRDQDTLLARIRQLAGPDLVRVRRFTGNPLRPARFGARRGRVTYAYPDAGTPVLLLTDLGIGGMPATEAATVGEWLEFARNARLGGCQVIALVPYAPYRWPPPLTKAMTVVQWDRTTTAASVRNRPLEFTRQAPIV